MKNYILLFLIIFIISIGNVRAVSINITEVTTVVVTLPNTNYGNDANAAVYTTFGWPCILPAGNCLDIPVLHNPINTTYIKNIQLHIWINDFTHTPLGFIIYQIPPFNESTLTFNTLGAGTNITPIDFKEQTLNDIGDAYYTLDFLYNNNTGITNLNDFVILVNTSAPHSGIQFDSDDGDHPPYMTYNTDMNISGITYFKDVNNSISILPYTKIELNNTMNTTSDINGTFNFTNININTYILQAIKNNAYSIEYNTINVINSYQTINITLNFSKPFVSTPYLNGNFIQGVYSNNIRAMDLWENPNYVFGIYSLDNITYYKQCLISSGNTFACDKIPNQNYEFHFLFSDIYNSDLTYYHPTLIGARNFTSESLIISEKNMNASSGQLSKNPNREGITKNSFYTYLVILLLLIILIFVSSIGEKRKIKIQYDTNR
jgi:hypothetical protein